MQITRTHPDSKRGPQEWFTGDVWYDELAIPPAPSRLRVLSVHFAPAARSWWHTHPVGQMIHVTEGVALAQCEGGPVERIEAGQTVFFEPGEVHWHGAAPGTFMTHLAAQEASAGGETVEWLRPVTDAEYGA